jgi:phosphoribosylamine-glycine ligase/intein/homing endonuclease
VTNFLFVSIEALSTDLAWQLAKAGHQVKLFTKSQSEKDVGDGFVEKVDAWEPFKDWAEVIVFDDIGFGELAEKLRTEGKAVVGGSVYTDKLENDREFGQKELTDAGVNTLQSWNFTSFDEAVEFVKKNPDRYVIKPSGNAQNEKELLFVGQEEDGRDVEQVLVHYKLKWSNKIKFFQIQKYETGVEVGIGAFFNGKDFVYPININFEHKRLFPNNIGPSTGEMGCYDDKTEVLTSDGWKLFKDVSREDEICTLEPNTHAIEFNRPYAIVSFDHHKKLISIQNRALDIVVTPDHNMYVESQQDHKKHRENFGFVKARDLQSQSRMMRTGKWAGRARESFTLPSVSIGHFEGHQVQLRETGAIEIPMGIWLAFMGIWLSDGSVSANRGSYRVSIAQRKPAQTERIEGLLSKLPFNFSKGASEFYCYDKQLGSYLEQFGGAPDKQVPRLIKELTPAQIGIFLDWFGSGDGTLMKTGFRIFYTSSRLLADQLQELLLKIGRLGLIKSRRRGGKLWIKDHFADSSRTQYEVIERVKKLHSWIDKRDTKVIAYEGRVYCASVKNHIMYVRRNGKPCWCGNTSMYWTKDSPLFENTLLKTKEKLAASKYVGYIDLNCIANTRGIYPLEWTCFDSETEILTGDGWKGYADVRVGDVALSINPETKELAWKTISGKIVKKYEGRMIRIGAKSKSHTALDALVTPDHSLLIEYSGRIRFARADSIPIHDTKVVRTGLFKGKTIESVEVPEYVETHYLGRHKTAMQIVHPAIKVETHHFMSFLGLYLAEGSMGDHIISIAQSPANPKRAQIQEVLDSTGLKYTVQKNGAYQFSSRQLLRFLETLGLAHVTSNNKFLPKQFKELSPDLLESFLHGYALGDGNRHTTRGNQLTFGTSSKRLADDVQELLIKCGKVANIRVQKQKGTTSIGGYTRNEDMHIVSVREKKMDYSLDKRVISEESYDGLVWDVEVEGWHTMLVRRRGKPFFSGNCRFGYPTISIQMEGVTSEWGAFLGDIAQGKDAQLKTKKGYQVGVVVAIPPFPFEDEKAFRKYSEDATILFKKPNLNGVHIGEVKLVDGDWHVAGKSGYVLVVTGSGQSMQDAINTAYQAVRNVMVPNMFYRDDIGQRWFRDVDMLLSWGYL